MFEVRRTIQIKRRTNQRKMTKRLGRIPQLLATATDLLREHTQVIRETEHVLKDVDCAREILGVVDAGAGHGFDEPEGAHAEGAFAAADAWGCQFERRGEGREGMEGDVPSSECSVS